MVISDEIKFPRPLHIDPYKKEKQIDAMSGINPVARIGKFKKEWQQDRGRKDGKRKWLPLALAAEKNIRNQIDAINDQLESQNILIHLVLVKRGTEYSLDLYDCTDQKVCNMVHDIVIDIHDIPHLLRSLQRESGILIDTIS